MKSKAVNIIDIIYAYIYIFLAIFGVKLNGFIDFTVFAYLFMIFLCCNKSFVNFRNRKLLIILALIICYNLLVFLVNSKIDAIFIAKFLRVFLAVIATGYFINYVTPLSRGQLVHIVINVLLLHAIVIVIESTIWIELQNILKIFSGYEREPLRFRGTGFTNGYDFAGVMCVIGLLLAIFGSERRYRIVKELIFIGGCFLSSRVNMLVIEVVFLIILFNHKKIKYKKDKYLCVIFLLITAIPVLGIFLYSTFHTENIIVTLLSKIEIFNSIFKNIANSYAITDILDTASQHFSFDNISQFQFIFGAATEANQDPGYTQFIFQIGLVGLILSIAFYYPIICSCLKNRKIKDRNNLNFVILIFVIIIFILSFKNSYILARHVTDLIIILYYLTNYKMHVKSDSGIINDNGELGKNAKLSCKYNCSYI